VGPEEDRNPSGVGQATHDNEQSTNVQHDHSQSYINYSTTGY